MDFDIDSFLNETFKKVEKKDKKKNNESKTNDIKDPSKNDKKDLQYNIKQPQIFTQQNKTSTASNQVRY